MIGWDVMAGVSIGFMVVPQGMSYALLAGLPPVYGLYSSFVPVIMYAAFGSSRHLAVGPVAGALPHSSTIPLPIGGAVIVGYTNPTNRLFDLT